jgi:hypothetical protein
VAGRLGGHARRGQFPQFVIDDREEFRGGAAVSLLRGFDETGQFRHRPRVYRPLMGTSPTDPLLERLRLDAMLFPFLALVPQVQSTANA